MDSHAFLKLQLAQLTGDLKRVIAQQKGTLPSPLYSIWQAIQIGSTACQERLDNMQTGIKTPTSNQTVSSPSFEKISTAYAPTASTLKPDTGSFKPFISPKEAVKPAVNSKEVSTTLKDSSQTKEGNPESAFLKKKETKKMGSFTLESPPNPLVYDLQGPEKWFQHKGMQKLTDETKKAPAPAFISKSAKFPPIVILHKAQSPYLESLEKLKIALTRSFLPTACTSDTPSMRDALIDALECKRLNLLLIEPGFDQLENLLLYPQTKKIESSQLEEPSQKIQLWKSISDHLSKPLP